MAPIKRSAPRLMGITALVALFHLVLFWLVARPVPTPAVRDQRVWIQLLRPSQTVHLSSRTERRPEPISQQRHAEMAPRKTLPLSRPFPRAPEASRPIAAAAPKAPPQVITESAEERALLDDPVTTKGAPATVQGDVLQQVLKSAGAIDRQLRAERPQEITAPVDTPMTRLSKGIAAAHAAVKPKWFESARIELVSAPNDSRRIYRITGVSGEYCLYYPDKGSISANSDPMSGRAGFGQPKAAACPIPF